jgi:N-dimethylarginine dimethylaminohydrolase
VPEPIRANYQWLEVTREEQDQLATNVLVLSRKHVISRTSSVRVNAMLRDVGIEVTEVTFREWTKSGGAFRCASLPLVRE